MTRLILIFATLTIIVSANKKDLRSNSNNYQEDFEFVEESDEKLKNSESKDGIVWIFDPKNELCSLLRCGDNGLCLLQDKFTAVCVDKEEASKYGDRIIPAKKLSGNRDDLTDDEENEYFEDDDEDYYYDDDNDVTGDVIDDVTASLNEGRFGGDKKAVLPKLNRKPFAKKQCPTCPVVRPVFLCGSDNKTYSSMCRLHYHNCLHEANVRMSCKGFCPCKEQQQQQQQSQSKMEKQRKHQNKHKNKNLNKKKMGGNEGVKKTRDFGPNSVYKTRNPVTGLDRDKDRKRNFRNFVNDKPYHVKKNAYRKSKSFDKYWLKKRNFQKLQKKDVFAKSENSVWGPDECSPEALEAMGNRMLDWFSVIMTDSRRRPFNPKPGPNWCKKEVSWMLSHLDQNNDEKLNQKELYRLEHDDRERCIKPFIDRCDLDRDQVLSSKEWCKCFDRSERPCAALRKSTQDLLGGYMPECDSEGYYRATQCHPRASMCWCVDKHGTELAGTRTRGTLNCEKIVKTRRFSSNNIDDDSDSELDDGDIYESSGDRSLDF